MAAAHAGPLGAYLIAAGPGTGKTWTMAERFCWLVERARTAPDSIFTVTFMERAAAELSARIAARLGDDRRPGMETAWIGTFHSLCARLLRENAYLVGLPRELRVLDDVGQALLIDRLQAELRSGAVGGIDLDRLPALNATDVSDLLKRGLGFVLKLKGRGIGPEEFRRRALEIHQDTTENPLLPAYMAEADAILVLHAVYAAYETALAQAGLMDFDDLILTTIAALKRVPAFREACHRRFRFLLVDEFQDSNQIQLELIRLLGAEEFQNVSVVGDAKQSIYGWRDADIENIRTRFPGTRLPLTRNRRSRQEILDAATAFVRLDPAFADEPELVADRGGGGSSAVTLIMAGEVDREARMVAAEIRRLIEAGVRRRDIAILATSLRYLPREFESALRQAGIPYVTSTGSGFFDREEVKDVIALLRLAEDPMDDGALVRVLQGPIVRVGDADMYRVAMRRSGRRSLRLRDCLLESAAEGHPELDPEAMARADRMLDAVGAITRQRDALTVADLLNRLLERTGYLRHTQLRAAREGPRGLLNLRKVFAMAGRFERELPLGGVSEFVRHLDRMLEADVRVGEAEGETAEEAVQLLTVHGAKGLEFPVVFLINLRPPRASSSDQLFFDPDGFGFVMKRFRGEAHPRFRATSASDASVRLILEERRRTVYVALTRARDRLYVSATRIEGRPEEILPGENDHFAELMSWALAHPDRATVVESEQLRLAQFEPVLATPASSPAVMADVLHRLELITGGTPAEARDTVRSVSLSFSQLQQFQVCPVRYRFAEVWRVPSPPDELLELPARAAAGSAGLGAAVHAALNGWHRSGEPLLELFAGLGPAFGVPEAGLAAGRSMLEAYLAHPLATAPTLGTEVEFNLHLESARVRGVVDRICRVGGRTVLVDYKTNARLDASLVAAYSIQLRLYGLAAARGLLPGGSDPDLILFDLRSREAIEITPDPGQVTAVIAEAAARIGAGRFELGPEHARRPCQLCAYRPICPQRR